MPAQPSSTPLFSALDSTRFGLRIGRASISNPAELSHALETARTENLRLLFARCPAEATPAIHAIEDEGGRLMDTLLYYRSGLRAGAIPEELRANRVRLLRAGEEPEIARVARACFTGYLGHYHADPLLDRAACDAAYVDWAVGCCRDQALDVLVGEDAEGKPCGFFVVRLNSPREGEGWLAGVAPEAEGRGLYWSLMVHAMRRCLEKGASRMIVSTQLSNTATQKVYCRLGYNIVSGLHTFHIPITASG